MPNFVREDVQFHYLDRGSAMDEDIPVFFQHGLGSETARVFDLIESPPGFRLLGLDCRGHGLTIPLGSVEQLRFDSFADDLVALMDHLKLSRAVVGGTSMGAGVALNCALRHPERVIGLVLLRPAWLDRPNPENVATFGTIARLIRAHGPERAAQEFQLTAIFRSIRAQSLDSASSLLDLFAHPRAAETVAKLERIPADAPNRDRTEWRRIAIPTLALATGQDPIHPLEFGTALAEEIPHAEFAELTPKSVSVPSYTAELNAALSRFLRRHFATH